MTPALVALALTVAAPALKDPPAKDPPLVGRWAATKLVINGRAEAQHAGLEYEFTRDGGWIIYRDGKPLSEIARTYTTNTKAKPAAVDLFERADGSAMPGIYKVDSDTLTLSFQTEKGTRPADFDVTKGIMMVVLSRVKAKD